MEKLIEKLDDIKAINEISNFNTPIENFIEENSFCIRMSVSTLIKKSNPYIFKLTHFLG
jgi:hypothetical protein